jgi:hypothetical protein
VRTLGIDLSTAETQTAACELHWDGTEGRDLGGAPRPGLGDGPLLELMASADTIGIDAPFGWPDAFRTAIQAWSEHDEWPAGSDRRPLRLRRTDAFLVSHGRTPMSVSSDRIAATAMRCADLLSRHHETRGVALDRVDGHAAEVYPAGALVVWGFDVRGYKERGAGARRRELVERLVDEADLELTPETVAACAASDHVLDALVCSLIARARALGLTHAAPEQHRDQIAREGWIHLPVPGSLRRLARGQSL